MFQFTRFPPLRVTRCDPRRVSPFGHFRLMRLHTAHRNFSQCTTSFFGTLCPGIPRMLLLTFATCDTEKLILSRSCFFCFLVLFVWYSIGKLHPEFLGFRLTPAAVGKPLFPFALTRRSQPVLRSSFLRQKQPGISPGCKIIWIYLKNLFDSHTRQLSHFLPFVFYPILLRYQHSVNLFKWR